MRMLSVLIILAVALQAGTALAGVKKLAPARDQNRANVMQYYNKVQRAYDQAQKKLNSAKYLEVVTARIPPRKGPTVVLKGKNAKPRIQSGSSPAKGHLQKAWKDYFNKDWKDLTKAERALLRNLGWNHRPSYKRRVNGTVSTALEGLGNGPITAERTGQVAQAIASQVANQVAGQGTQQLLGQTSPSLEDRNHLQKLKQQAGKNHAQVKKLYKQKSRELRAKRRPLKSRK